MAHGLGHAHRELRTNAIIEEATFYADNPIVPNCVVRLVSVWSVSHK